jgi:TatD DNase family protein
MYVDVHTHLTHEKFSSDKEEVIQRAIDAGLEAIVVNGLEPKSNREILELAERYSVIVPALGIYPIDGVCDRLPSDLPFSVTKFDVDGEIAFIDQMAKEGKIKAVGECGLDGHWLGEETFKRQEEVFEKLIEVAMNHDLPIIIHTRKREARSAEILLHHGVKKVDFHCYGGKTKFAIKWAEDNGWYFSIPANANLNQAFAKLLAKLPAECILTETDAPYLGPVKGERNEPSNVVGTIAILAEKRSITIEEAQALVWTNYKNLFNIQPS